MASTWTSAVTVKLQVGVGPAQAPLQPTKRWCKDGSAVRLTGAPTGSRVVHSAPQSMWPLASATRPWPGPLRVTVTACVITSKSAPTPRSPFIVRRHSPVPVQAPVQPPNVEVVPGAAVSRTDAPKA